MENNNYKIAFLSGKGGTGKTLLSVNLASVIPNSTYYDCDIEEPNGHLFFKPIWSEVKEVSHKIPVIDSKTCIHCGKCSQFCAFNALAMIRNKIILFEELCHACGGCVIVCPVKAISEKNHSIGHISIGKTKSMTIYSGMMNIGESSGVDLIQEMLKTTVEGVSIIDAPPGSSCAVNEVLEQSDFAVIVSEPSIFGLENIKIIVSLLRKYSIPFGIILNKALDGENQMTEYAQTEHIQILGKIMNDEVIAYRSSNSQLLTEDQRYRALFMNIWKQIKEVLS